MNNEIEALQRTIEAQRENIEAMTAERASQHENAQARITNLEDAIKANRDEYRDSALHIRDRREAREAELLERIETLTNTEQGTAVEQMRQAELRAERSANDVTEARGLQRQAESDRDRALASVADGDEIHPADPRVAHIWRKASRIATARGYCSEYDAIAEALNLPEVELDYSGTITVRVNAFVNVPVSGTDTRRNIANGDVEWSIDNSDILDNLNSDNLDWEVDEVEIECEDD